MNENAKTQRGEMLQKSSLRQCVKQNDTNLSVVCVRARVCVKKEPKQSMEGRDERQFNWTPPFC